LPDLLLTIVIKRKSDMILYNKDKNINFSNFKNPDRKTNDSDQLKQFNFHFWCPLFEWMFGEKSAL